ncbi:MAG TPA: glycosyltransferase family 4 protein [Dissulfurispiraceae bacterium]|nr:glycosyltransferase family 4 protein [Dissulfurispiraceae bacterium]
MNINNKIVMVGPDPLGKGGVSRVVSIWKTSGFFENFAFEYVGSTRESSRSRILNLSAALFKFVRTISKARLVYIHSSAYISFYRKSIFVLLSVVLGKKVVFHIHPTGFAEFYKELSGLRLKYANFILKKTDTIVVLTGGMKQLMQSFFPEKRVHVLPNAVDVRALADRHGIQRKDNELLYLGWYIRAKGVYELVDAVGLLRKNGRTIHLNFFGTKKIDELRDYVRTKGLDDVISINHWIDDVEKLRVLYSSSVLILPSHSEGMPNVILEAMATRTPVIATSVGGMRELLRNEQNAIITGANNPFDLAEKIEWMLQDKYLRDHLVENAYREIEQNHDVSVIRTRFREFITSVME